MIAATTAAGFPFADTKHDHNFGSSSSSTSVSTSKHAQQNLDPSFGYTTSTLLASTGSSSSSRMRIRSRTPSTSTYTQAPSQPVQSLQALQAQQAQRRATVQSPGLVMRLVFAVWDWAWRQWYSLISTWGISVMEPWERVFTLVLFGSLLALFGVALIKLPTYTQYALKRLGYYLFGNSRRIPSTIAELKLSPLQTTTSSILTSANDQTTAPVAVAVAAMNQLNVEMKTHMCQQVLANISQAAATNSSAPLQPTLTVSGLTNQLLSRWSHNS